MGKCFKFGICIWNKSYPPSTALCFRSENRKHAQEEMRELEGWGDVVGLLLLVFLKSTIWSF